MGLGKTYSTKYLVDSNNNTGAVGEVLVSTATGINWANGSDIVGGPYLPLAGGTMTGTAGIIFPDDFKLNIGTGSDLQIYHNGTNDYIVSTGTYNIFEANNHIFRNLASNEDYAKFIGNGGVELYYNNVKKFETTSAGATVSGALAVDGKITNLTAGTGNLDAVNVQQLNDATTGALIFKGTWSASPTTTSNTLGATVSSTTFVISSPNTGISVDATVTGGGLPANITVTAISANGVTLTISSAQSIPSNSTLTFTTVGGTPDLSQTARKVTGDYYICETAGVATPNGASTTPDDWAVGDWVAFSDLATDAWQKIDNSSVLSGAGTGGTVPVWAGSGTSVTLADSPITISGASTIFGARGLFSDNVQIIYTGSKTNDAGLYIENDSDDWGVHVNKNTSNFGIRITSDGGNAFGIYSDAGVNKINFSGTGNAAFAGDVTLSSTSPILYLANTTATTGKTWRLSSATNGNAYITQDGVIDAITLSHTSGNAAFAGTVTSPTFIGDLNGTINTATTGATQTAGNNSTLIATTAYADAAAATGGGNFLPLAGGTMSGDILLSEHSVKFDQSGTRSWDISASSGNLNITSGDSAGLVFLSPGISVEDNAYFGGNVGIGITAPSEKLEVDGNVLITSALLSNQENTNVDTGAETVASVLKATYTAAFFDFVIKEGTNLRAGTVFACHDGTNVVYTETSTNDLGDTSDVTLSVDISGTAMRLRATVTSDDWIIKSLIRAI